MESVTKIQKDYLIVGQGLAGSLIALNLLQRGKKVLVIDDGHKHSASKVAAGLINPITGRRHVLSWRFLECWDFLCSDYSRWEKQFNDRFFHEMPLLRFLRTEEEKLAFEQKFEAENFSGVELEYPYDTTGVPGLNTTDLCYQLFQTGYVDQNKFIQTVRKWLAEEKSLMETFWNVSEFSREMGSVSWRGIQAAGIIFTQGYMNDKNPFFRDLPFRHAKGELLDLTSDSVGEPLILNRGKWLLPLGDGRYRAGATYDLESINLRKTENGKQEIMEGLSELVDWKLNVENHRAGIRPALHDFKPVMGKHPWFPELIIFNGLGSKGSLLAPLLAKELVEHLEDGMPIHPESDIERFRKYL